MKIIIVGSGFGGVKATLELQNRPGIDVQLISNHSSFDYHAALYRSATGKSPLEVVIPLRDIFDSGSDTDVVLDEIVGLNPENKQLHGQSGRNYDYDVLILAIGQVPNDFGITGIAEHAYNIDTITGTIKLRQHLHDMVLEGERQQALNFVVVGGGASGVELAAELVLYTKELAWFHHQVEKPVDVVLVEAGERLLPLLHPKLSNKAQKRLESLGVKVILGRRVEAFDGRTVSTGDIQMETETLIWAAGFKNNEFFKHNKAIFKLGRAGRVVVNDFLGADGSIYVIGDNADTEYSGMAQTALYDARFVARDILSRAFKQKRKQYVPRKPIYVIPVGHKFAVMQWGSFKLSGRLAWVVRRIADFRLFSELEPFKKAVKTWRQGNRQAESTCEICEAK